MTKNPSKVNTGITATIVLFRSKAIIFFSISKLQVLIDFCSFKSNSITFPLIVVIELNYNSFAMDKNIYFENLSYDLYKKLNAGLNFKLLGQVPRHASSDCT